jgi:hypothetical protein
MKQRAPIYTLDHGIEVIGEYPAKGKNRYARLRIRPHRFFPGVPVVSNGIYVRKSRVLLAAKLGRALSPAEHAHHDDEDRTNDTAENIKPLSPAEHNRHHKTGTKHRDESKQKTSASLKRAYAEGRHSKAILPDQSGANNRNAKLTAEQAIEIRNAVGTQNEIADRYNVSRSTIRLIKNGVTWK